MDSEAVPARLASLGKLAALPIVMEEIVGAAAIAAVDEKHPADLALARGYQSPLFVLRTKKIVLFGGSVGSWRFCAKHDSQRATQDERGGLPTTYRGRSC